MGNRKRMIWLPILMMLLVCAMPAVQAAAADTDGIWLRTEAANGNVTASICVNTTVSDGMIELQYDSAQLTFVEVEVDQQYVSLHVVNAQETGVVKVAWITSGDYGKDGTAHILLRVRFSGTSADSLTLSGAVHNAAGTEIAFTALDLSQLEAAIAAAQAYHAGDYTAESFAALETALAQAQVALQNELSTQADVDTAVSQLKAAMDGLVEYVVEPTQPTQPTEPTEPTQPATNPTQPTTQPTTPPTQPDVEPAPDPKPGSGLWIGIAAALVVAGAAVVVIIKKKEVRK